MKKFRIHVKCIQEVTFEVPASYYPDQRPEEVIQLEEYNVRSDPTYFNFLDGATENVEVEVEVFKDAKV